MASVPARNDPCPCGSGLKYKKCCGAPPAPRHCGTCTACCDGWLKIEIHGHKVYPGQPCPYSTGHSCRIYADRPEHPCRHFMCGWMLPNSPLPPWMRPDQVGVIVLWGAVNWRGLQVDVLVPAGRDPEPRMLSWFREQSLRTRRPFVYQMGGQWHGFGPQEMESDLVRRIASGEGLW